MARIAGAAETGFFEHGWQQLLLGQKADAASLQAARELLIVAVLCRTGRAETQAERTDAG